MSDLLGQKLGQYEITSLIGRGGMATVYLAHQPSVGRTVAVKVLPPQLLHEETFLQRFKREVQAVARLQHPRIVPVYDYGEDHGMPYIVMAYIEGGSLAEVIKAQGALPLDETRRIVSQIAEGLDYAHNRGVIHRDFKPSNVLLDSSGNAYLSDFGIAKVSQETIQLTGSGIVGTPTYMAPEMFKQEAATPSVDIYALGVTLYQMLSGDAPYGGTTPVQLMYAHLNEPVPSIETARPDLPPQVQIVLDRAMAKNPVNRYATARDLSEELDMAARGDLMMDEHTVPLSLPTTGTVTASPAPTGKVDEAQPAAPQPTGKIEIVVPAAVGAKVDELARFREMKREESLRQSREQADRKREDKQERAREKWEDRPHRKGGPWLLWLIIGLVVFFAVCKGGSLIGGLVGAAMNQAAKIPDMNGTPASGTIHQPIEGANSLIVSVSVSTGSLDIHKLNDPATAADGSYSGYGDINFDLTYDVQGGIGVLKIAQQEMNSARSGLVDKFTLGLTDAMPIDLTINTGAGESTLDLSGMQISALKVKGGAGKFTVILPSSGSFSLDMNAGMGETVLVVPDTVEAQAELSSGLSNIEVNDKRFSEVSPNIWETSGYQSASDKVRISVTSGMGQVRIEKQ